MKVLQLLPALEVGGVERGVIDLAREMKRRGEESVIISSGGELVQELQKLGIPHYTLPVHRKSFSSLALIPKIVRIIEREHIDLVHARSRVPAWLGWVAARQTGRPFITTCHGYYSAHFLSRVMGWGKRVIVISKIIGRHMIDHFGVSPDRVRLIYRGVDLTQFRWNEPSDQDQEAPRSKSRPFRILNIGRLSPIKGQIEFLKAIHQIRSRLPLEVWLAGSEGKGKSKYTDLLTQTIRQLNLESTVKLLGTRRDIPELLAQSDLLALSTLVPEAFGRVVIEAGAVGIPVLATRVGGVLEIIRSGDNGLLVPPGDIEAMARGILEILQDRPRAKNFAARLHEKVMNEFSLERMADQTLEVYREVLSEKKILIAKLGAIGDLILATPSFRMIRERFPRAWISLLVDRKLGPLVSSSPYLNEIIPLDRKKLRRFSYFLKLAKKLRGEAFDLSLDLQNSKWTHLLSFAAAIPERYGFRKKGALGFLLNRPEATFAVPESPVKHQYRLLSKIGVRTFHESLELWSDPEAEAKATALLEDKIRQKDLRCVGFVVGSSSRWITKRWPIFYFQELARRLIQKHRCCVVLLGAEEDASCVRQSDFSKNPEILDVIGKTSLRELVALIKRLDVLVTGDTAPLHVAGAVNTKVVALFGPTDPRRHMTPGNGSIVLKRRLACQPCYQGTCRIEDKGACLKQISVDEVEQAVLRQLLSVETEKRQRIPSAVNS